MDIGLPKHSLIGCILRGEKAIIPKGDTIINKLDKLIIITLNESKNKTLEILRKRSK